MRAIAVFGILVLSLLSVESAQAQDTPAFFKADGQDIVNPAGEPVVLKGVGLGGWLMPEGYMLHIQAPDGGSPRSIRSQIVDLIGEEDADAFYEVYRANYVDEKDIAAIAAWGFDHIRLPFHYNLFFDPDTQTFREDGFALLDTFLEWCRAYDLGVILDMHAAPGAQSEHNIADSDGEARLWTEPVPYQDQTVAIWKEIARRYVDETLIIGYDLINEPVTPDGITGFDLRNLYIRITEAIREVDTNHIVFIEGNFFATHFPELIPPFDDNMVYAFHKYWNGTGTNSVQYLLDIRSQTNVPLWLGETGENSNPWFYLVTQLMETHGIGTNWWTHKKVQATTSPLSSPITPEYQAVIDYWRGNAPRPTAEAAKAGLFSMAENLDMDSTEVNIDVLAALFNPDFARIQEPFKEHNLPGYINAVDYDRGMSGVAYRDNDVMATSGSPGGGNNGGRYRNDGVDIEASTDPKGFEFNVGWTNTSEWIKYTVNVERDGIYDIELRVASAVGGALFELQADNKRLGDLINVGNTGGWQNWTSTWIRGVELQSGQRELKLFMRGGEFNINRMFFTLVQATSSDEEPALPEVASLQGHYPNPFAQSLQINFATPNTTTAKLAIYDALGREVYRHAPTTFVAGQHTLELRPNLSSGTYFYQLLLQDRNETKVFTRPVSVVK